jgi:hypothetical protein
MTFTLLLLSIAVLGPVAYFLASRKKNELAAIGWEQLIGKLESVPIEGVARVANDYLQPRKGQLAIQTDEMWFLVGEEEGLRRMEANAEVLIALAAFASQWNFEESVIVAERMRRDGMTLRRAVRKISLGLAFGDRTMGPFYVQEAASAYWLMRERLLALYQTSHAGRYPRLLAAL